MSSFILSFCYSSLQFSATSDQLAGRFSPQGFRFTYDPSSKEELVDTFPDHEVHPQPIAEVHKCIFDFAHIYCCLFIMKAHISTYSSYYPTLWMLRITSSCLNVCRWMYGFWVSHNCFQSVSILKIKEYCLHVVLVQYTWNSDACGQLEVAALGHFIPIVMLEISTSTVESLLTKRFLQHIL